MGGINPETEKKIREKEDLALLENVLDNIFDLESEKALIEALDR